MEEKDRNNGVPSVFPPLDLLSVLEGKDRGRSRKRQSQERWHEALSTSVLWGWGLGREGTEQSWGKEKSSRLGSLGTWYPGTEVGVLMVLQNRVASS
jgi:hypothetical protein